MRQTISCPNCNGSIPFDVHALLQGQRFECPECHCVVAMDRNSKPLVERAMEQYDKLMRHKRVPTDGRQ